MLYGKYASARDVGNFAAGIIKAKSFLGHNIIQWGFGTYNISGNNKSKTIGIMLTDWILMNSEDFNAQKIGYKRIEEHSNGEDRLSQMGIDAGYNYQKQKKITI